MGWTLPGDALSHTEQQTNPNQITGNSVREEKLADWSLYNPAAKGGFLFEEKHFFFFHPAESFGQEM